MSSILKKYKITDKAAWRQFLLHNHPDKGGDTSVFISVKNAYEKYGPQQVSKPKKDFTLYDISAAYYSGELIKKPLFD